MRVFNNRTHSPPVKQEVSTETPKKSGVVEREIIPGKLPPRMSSSDIRARMEELKKETHTQKFERAKKMNERRLQGNSYMNEDPRSRIVPDKPKPQAEGAAPASESAEGEHVQAGEGHVINSDIAANDPKAPETQEKLKQVLSNGAFTFNEKERSVLDKILAGQS